MNLDLRLPLGLIFSLFGLILVGFGMASDASLYVRSLGINVNLAWGAVILALGGLMLFLAYRGRK